MVIESNFPGFGLIGVKPIKTSSNRCNTHYIFIIYLALTASTLLHPFVLAWVLFSFWISLGLPFDFVLDFAWTAFGCVFCLASGCVTALLGSRFIVYNFTSDNIYGSMNQQSSYTVGGV
jgi:hypothetical protein